MTGLRRSSLAANVLLLLASLVVGLLAVEVLLRLFYPLLDPYSLQKVRPEFANNYIPSQFPPNLVLNLETQPGLPGMAGRARFSVNNVGLRGDSLIRPRPVGEFRIFLVGGSTAECLYLDDRVAFTRALQDTLGVLAAGRTIRVYGAAKSGDRSYDHVAMIAHRLVRLQPDVIVVLAGANDLLAAINHRDYLFFPPAGLDSQLSFWQLVRYTSTEFQLPRLVFTVLKARSFRYSAERLPLVPDYRAAVERRKQLPLAAFAPETNIPSYRDNLLSMIGLARAHGVRIVFMTQASSWNSSIDPGTADWHWINLSGRGFRFTEASMDSALQRYNAETLKVGAEQNVPVFDLAAVLPKSREYLYDDLHFNVRGASAAAALLARFLAEQIVDRGSWIADRGSLSRPRFNP